MMPLFGLAAFLFLPWAAALPLYLVISAVSLLIYAQIMRAQRAPVATGREGMIGREAQVVSDKLINYRGELWEAVSQEELHPGERVRIVDLEGMRAVVARPADDERSEGDSKDRPTGHR